MGNKGGGGLGDWPKDKMHRHTSLQSNIQEINPASRSGVSSLLGGSNVLPGRAENLDGGLRPSQDWVAEPCPCVPTKELTCHFFSFFFFPASCRADANSQPPSVGEAFVTLVTSHAYCMGAVVVARSLRRHGTTRSLVVMVTPNVSEQSR